MEEKDIIKERLKNHKAIYTKEEYKILEQNYDIFRKSYIIGFLDGYMISQ